MNLVELYLLTEAIQKMCLSERTINFISDSQFSIHATTHSFIFIDFSLWGTLSAVLWLFFQKCNIPEMWGLLINNFLNLFSVSFYELLLNLCFCNQLGLLHKTFANGSVIGFAVLHNRGRSVILVDFAWFT